MDIVVGVDGSPVRRRHSPRRSRGGRLRQATLHVVHVVYVPATLVNGMTFMPGNLIESTYEFAETVKTTVWERVGAALEGSHVKWVQVDRSGYPPNEIVDCAKSIEAGLIVVGSRGFGDLKSLYLARLATESRNWPHATFS